jgi:hypothetical protein
MQHARLARRHYRSFAGTCCYSTIHWHFWPGCCDKRTCRPGLRRLKLQRWRRVERRPGWPRKFITELLDATASQVWRPSARGVNTVVMAVITTCYQAQARLIGLALVAATCRAVNVPQKSVIEATGCGPIQDAGGAGPAYRPLARSACMQIMADRGYVPHQQQGWQSYQLLGEDGVGVSTMRMQKLDNASDQASQRPGAPGLQRHPVQRHPSCATLAPSTVAVPSFARLFA